RLFSLLYKVSDNITYLKDLKAENENLKHQLVLLEKLKSENQIIEAENIQLRRLLNTVPDPVQSFFTARLLSVVNNPFSRSVLIAAGADQGTKINQLVTNDEGLIGRIIKQTNNYSKVMTINDTNSHIPIITSITREKGILVGYNTGAKIIHLSKNHSAQIGEKIITSGDGNIYPYGINVAKIVEINDTDVLAEPIVNLSRVEFVNVYD
ncbi:MAG: rod shape-determining protein MreC, partial [Janthinobacterium lividum]